jgi:hypothetical protein
MRSFPSTQLSVALPRRRKPAAERGPLVVALTSHRAGIRMLRVSASKIVVAVQVLDNADTLREYLEWYRELEVDLVLAHDFGSVDGSRDILDEYARRNFVKWSHHPNKCIQNYDPTAKLARQARDEHGADWVLHFDTDEFLCVEGDDLRAVLDRATENDLTVLPTRGANMTGHTPPAGHNPLRTLTLRIDRGLRPTVEEQIAGEPPFPFVFFHWPPKAIVKAPAFSEYGPGNHRAESAWGRTGEAPQLRFLHFPFRGFEALETKVRHAEEWFAANPQLEAKPRWGWHWRRWVRMAREGRLREEYDRQFVSPERAAELIADGSCAIDRTVANWLARRDDPAAVRVAHDAARP